MAGKGKSSDKVWSGRIAGPTSPLMEAFSRSIDVDRRMWHEDLAVNQAWAAALRDLGVYTAAEHKQIRQALGQIAREFEQDAFVFQPGDEDIHVAIERRLTELAGDAGARIHTGRSRNDQVSTDARLYLKRRCGDWLRALVALQQVWLELAESHQGVSLPGYTHMQQAQPILLSHFLLAGFWGIDRTITRLSDYFARLDEMPLGCGALAGSAFAIDRAKLAAALGFARPSPNSIDATGDRDFCAELLFIIGAFFTNLSRFCAELQLWSSRELGFIEFADAYATGSSMMPQKKNPDAMELIRGKAAAAIAASNQVLVLQKGLPLTYNRDLQEDKPVTFRQLDEAIASTELFREAIATARFASDAMAASIDPLTLATDLADYLVRKGLPFRRAHGVAGAVVREALADGVSLPDMPLAKLRRHSGLFEDDVYAALTIEASLGQRNLDGGTGPAAVARQLKLARDVWQGYAGHPFLRGA